MDEPPPADERGEVDARLCREGLALLCPGYRDDKEQAQSLVQK
jgi:hypothetical protein